MATLYLIPNAAGDEANLNPLGGSVNWQMVDDPVGSPDEDATCVCNWTSTSYRRDLYHLPDPSGSGVVNWIKVHWRWRAKNASYPAYSKPAVKIGGSAYEGTEVNTASISYQNDSYQWTTNPNTGNPWTFAELNSLQAGISLRTGDVNYEPRCTQVYVEVDYTAVTAKTSSDTGSGVDAYVLLETGEAKASSDVGSGVEGAPLPSASLSGSETGGGIEAIIARLLASFDTGSGVDAGGVEIEGLFKDLFDTELGWGSDSLTAKIEKPTKGGGMKLWT